MTGVVGTHATRCWRRTRSARGEHDDVDALVGSRWACGESLGRWLPGLTRVAPLSAVKSSDGPDCGGAERESEAAVLAQIRNSVAENRILIPIAIPA